MLKKILLAASVTLAFTGPASAASYQSPGLTVEASAPVVQFNGYSGSHNFAVPPHMYDVPISDITFPGSHNSYNLSGTGPDHCVTTAGSVGPGDNKNVHRSISDQIKIMGLRFLEIDVYQESNGNWCVYHGSGGRAFLDGNSYYFTNIMGEVADGLNHIGKDPIIIKFDGGELTEDVLRAELARYGLEDATYQHPPGAPVPSINDLYNQGKRLIIVSGPMGAQMSGFGTRAGAKDRADPFRSIPTSPDRFPIFMRWNAWAVDDTFGWGSTGDADYLQARLVGHGIQKWVHAAHRINQLIVDFPTRQSVGMSAMRAANIMNQVPSIKGKVIDGNTGETMRAMQYRYWTETLNLNNAGVHSPGGWFTSGDYNNKTTTSGVVYGEFDFPRPHGQTVRIEPFKEGYMFEPAAVYVEAENAATAINDIVFKAYPSSPTRLAERHSLIYKSGHVTLAKGVDVDSDGRPFVNDVTRVNYHAIINKGSGLCIGVEGNSVYNGTPVKMQRCNGSINQQWQFDTRQGHIKSAMGNYCLDSQGNGNSGHPQKLYNCISHNNLTYNLIGQQIVPHYTSANALDSNGQGPGGNLIVWNRSSDHNNRKWIFERQYAVSSTGQNTVTDASDDGKHAYFLIANEDKSNCLTADGPWSTAYVTAKNCVTKFRSGGGVSSNQTTNMINSMWRYHDGFSQFRNKAGGNDNFCLDHKGVNSDSGWAPHIWSCVDNHNNMKFRMNHPYWGGAAHTAEPVGIRAVTNNSYYLDNPGGWGNTTHLYTFNNKVHHQGWVIIPMMDINTSNLAQGKPTVQKSTYGSGHAGKAVDGNTNGNWGHGSVTHTNGEATPWWQVDLQGIKDIEQIQIYNRTDCCKGRLSNYHVFVSNDNMQWTSLTTINNDNSGKYTKLYHSGQSPDIKTFNLSNVSGRYVRIQLSGSGNALSLAEVKVIGK